MSYRTSVGTEPERWAERTTEAATCADGCPPPVSHLAVGCAAIRPTSAASARRPARRQVAACTAAGELGFTHSFTAPARAAARVTVVGGAVAPVACPPE